MTIESTVPGVTDPIKQPIYENKIASIEKWTALIDFLMVKWTCPFATALIIIIVAVTYCTTGLTDEDYILVNQMW